MEKALRFALFTFTLCLSLSLPLVAGAKATASLPHPVPKKNRKLAAATPASTRVLTVSCTDQSLGSGEQALAIALLATDDSNAFSMSLYLKPSSDTYAFRQLSGKVSSVPGGLIFRASSWGQNPNDYFFLHAHPRDLTSFPGNSTRYQCRITGDMKP